MEGSWAERGPANSVGLDTFASNAPGQPSLSEEDERAFAGAGLELCGGMYSGDDGSFRGKVYAELILDVTGESLYQEWIPPEVVCEMAAALASCDPEAVAEPGIPAGVVADLATFFRICADRGLGLVGWW
jgi:hypothetical protein